MITSYIITPIYNVTYMPYSGKFSQDKIFADGSKNEISRIKFSWILAYRAEQEHNYAYNLVKAHDCFGVDRWNKVILEQVT